MSKPKLIAAMHAACGCQVKTCSEWLTAAERNDALRAAFRAVYGKRPPTHVKLGRDLKGWAGRSYGDIRLVSIFSTNAQAYRYAVETAAESTARENAEDNREERQEIIDADKEQRALERMLRKAGAAEAKKREAEELSIVGTLNIEVVQPAPAPVEYVTTTRVDQSTGRIIETPVMGRDGEPLKKKPAAVEPPVVTESPLAPWAGVNASGTPVLTRQPTRAELIARHNGKIPTKGGWANPGGVVSHNAATEGGPDFRTSRLRLTDF